MGLRDIGVALPPGFRFYPSDEELVCHYLYKKITNEELIKGTLVEIDLHTCEPWQLPEVAKLNANEWYFFSFRDRKYATGFRTNRATTSGYWKATGKDRTVMDPTSREVVGMRKTLVFYRNRAPNGIKTDWIMHEFRLETPYMPPKEDWVLCRVFHKSKGVNSNGRYPQFLFDATSTGANNNNNNNNINLVSPFNGYNNINQPINSNAADYEEHDPTSVLNLMQLSRGKNMATNDPVTNGGISSKVDDDFGYLWEDMNLEETSMGSSILEDNMLYN